MSNSGLQEVLNEANVDFDLWRQMSVEHLIGESQGGYLKSSEG
jgi:hypothetical protein